MRDARTRFARGHDWSHRQPWYKNPALITPAFLVSLTLVGIGSAFHEIQMRPPLALSSGVAWLTGGLTALAVVLVGFGFGLFYVQLTNRREGHVVSTRTLIALAAAGVIGLGGFVTAMMVSF